MSSAHPTSDPRAITELSHYIANALTTALPPEVVEKSKHHLLDTLAAMVTGARLDVGKLGIDYIVPQGGREEALVIGTKHKTTAINAALANGVSAHADETDDSHEPAFSHPGCVVVPAALAMAEKYDRSGEELLRAVVLGYDVLARIQKALGPRALKARGHGPYSIGGAWGAAAASAALAGLSQDDMPYLMSNIAQQTSGISTYPFGVDHSEKAFHFGGMGARNGVTAALMIEAGFKGVTDVFTCTRNFLHAFSDAAQPTELYRELGSDFEIMHANIKKWCVGSPVQAVLDATEALIAEHDTAASDVDHIDIYLPTHAVETVAERHMSNISAPHCVALMLVDRKLTFESIHDITRLDDSVVTKLKQTVRLLPSEELEHATPRRQAIVELHLSSGKILKHRTFKVKGTHDDPMNRTEVEAKARDLLESPMGKVDARRLIDTVWSVENLSKVRQMRELLSM